MKYPSLALSLLLSTQAMAAGHAWHQDKADLDRLVSTPVYKSSTSDIDYVQQIRLVTRNMVSVTEFIVDPEVGEFWCGEANVLGKQEPFATAIVDYFEAKLDIVCRATEDASGQYQWTKVKLVPNDQFSVDLFNMQYSSYVDFDVEISRNSSRGDSTIYQIKGEGLEEGFRALFERMLDAQ